MPMFTRKSQGDSRVCITHAYMTRTPTRESACLEDRKLVKGSLFEVPIPHCFICNSRHQMQNFSQISKELWTMLGKRLLGCWALYQQCRGALNRLMSL